MTRKPLDPPPIDVRAAAGPDGLPGAWEQKSLYALTKEVADKLHDAFYALQLNRQWRRADPVGIYLATCAATGLQYVGQSVNVWGRISAHLHSALRDKSQTPFHSALRDHGPRAFAWRLLAIVDGNVADETETLAIQAFKTLAPRGYNQKLAVRQSGYWGTDLRQPALLETRRRTDGAGG